jgi:hypothetical protein
MKSIKNTIWDSAVLILLNGAVYEVHSCQASDDMICIRSFMKTGSSIQVTLGLLPRQFKRHSVGGSNDRDFLRTPSIWSLVVSSYEDLLKNWSNIRVLPNKFERL